MKTAYASCAVTVALAGCLSTSSDRAGQSYTLLDPATGATYNMPLKTSRNIVVDAATLSRVRVTYDNNGDVRNVSAAAPGDDPAIVVASIGSATPITSFALFYEDQQTAAATSVQPAVHIVKTGGDNSQASASAPQPLHLKLDTEFESAKRLVAFAVGAASLGPIGKLAIAELVPWAKGAERVHVRGGADSSGDRARNRELAIARAAIVRKAFVAAGVDRQKISTSYCANCYVASNETEQGRRVNRRVEVELVLRKELFAKLETPVYSVAAPAPISLIEATMFHTTALTR